MIRIKDIAERAGVSPTTVSNVIHGNTKKVSSVTVKRIQQILQETNYVPSMGARLLACNHSNIIGFILGGHIQTRGVLDPFIGTLLGAIETEIYNQGYYMMLHIAKSPEENVNMTAAWNVDGLVTLGLSEEELYHLQKTSHIPLVTIDGYYSSNNQMVNIGLDDFDGGYQMAEFLIENGHQKMLFLSNSNIGVDYHRWQGICKAFSVHNLEITEKNHIIIPDKAEKRMEFYKEELIKFQKYSALFFSSDYYAAEAVNFLYENNISVPNDISVSGFDNNIYATMIRPKLTTVNQDIYMKGSLAVENLISLINEPNREALNVQLPVNMLVRESVKINKK